MNSPKCSMIKIKSKKGSHHSVMKCQCFRGSFCCVVIMSAPVIVADMAESLNRIQNTLICRSSTLV